MPPHHPRHRDGRNGEKITQRVKVPNIQGLLSQKPLRVWCFGNRDLNKLLGTWIVWVMVRNPITGLAISELSKSVYTMYYIVERVWYMVYSI